MIILGVFITMINHFQIEKVIIVNVQICIILCFKFVYRREIKCQKDKVD